MNPADSRSPVETDGETLTCRACLGKGTCTVSDTSCRGLVRYEETCARCKGTGREMFVSTPEPSEPTVALHPGTCERCRERPGMARDFGRSWLCDPCYAATDSQPTINASHADSSPPSAEELPEQAEERQDDSRVGAPDLMSIDEAVEITSDMDVDPLTIDECSAIDTLEFYARLYQRQQSALDALAVAVKGCDAELPDGTLCGEYDATRIALCAGCRRRRDMAIHALLDGRTTT